jgi:hypothetical protein
MMQIVQANKAAVLEEIKRGRIGDLRQSERNFAETIIKKMLKMGIVDELEHIVKEKRKVGPFLESENEFIPQKLLFLLAITAKMKISIDVASPQARRNTHDRHALCNRGY